MIQARCPSHPWRSHRPPTPTTPLALPPAIDARHALGSPSGRTGAKRLRGLTAPILPTSYPQIYCTDSLDETAFLHELSAHPSPPPFGRYLSGRERQGLCANFKQFGKSGLVALSTDAHRTLGSPSVHRCPLHPWLSLRESWHEAPERAHRTDSTHRLPTEPQHPLALPPGEARTVCKPQTTRKNGAYADERKIQGIKSQKLLTDNNFCAIVLI